MKKLIKNSKNIFLVISLLLVFSMSIVLASNQVQISTPFEYNIIPETKNNSAIDTSMIGVTVILKKGGQIVYGTTTFVNDVKAGAEKPFEVSALGTIPEHDAVEVTAIQWGH